MSGAGVLLVVFEVHGEVVHITDFDWLSADDALSFELFPEDSGRSVKW